MHPSNMDLRRDLPLSPILHNICHRNPQLQCMGLYHAQTNFPMAIRGRCKDMVRNQGRSTVPLCSHHCHRTVTTPAQLHWMHALDDRSRNRKWPTSPCWAGCTTISARLIGALLFPRPFKACQPNHLDWREIRM